MNGELKVYTGVNGKTCANDVCARSCVCGVNVKVDFNLKITNI